MPSLSAPDAALGRLARETTGLDLLMLFGSRARGEARVESDWDLGYEGADELDVDGLLARIVDALAVDSVDLVDLRRASGLLRFRAARDGRVVFERLPGLADAFRFEASRFWCDVEPVLRRGYERVLAELGR